MKAALCVELFCNGHEVEEIELGAPFTFQNTEVYVGRPPPSADPQESLSGCIEHVQIFKRALGSEEIRALQADGREPASNIKSLLAKTI